MLKKTESENGGLEPPLSLKPPFKGKFFIYIYKIPVFFELNCDIFVYVIYTSNFQMFF